MLRDPAIRLLMVVAAGAVLAIAAANIIIKASLPPIPTVMILMTITLLVAAAWRCLPKGQGQSKQDEREQRPATSLPAPTRTRTLAELLFLATDPMSIAGPASEWNTITHQKPVRGPAGVAPTLLRDASGQSYIQVRTPPEDPETLLTLRIPLSPMKLRLALTGRRPLKELAKEADWLLLTEQANNEDHPVNTLMVKGPLLLDNPKVAHLLPEDLCLSEPYETSQGWMLFTDDDLPPYPDDASEQRDQLLAHLRSSFAARPLEPGMDHPADDIVLRAIWTLGEDQVLPWLAEACANADGRAFPVELLSTLRHLHQPRSPEWRANLIKQALASPDVEMRDAAVQAADNWQGAEVREVLQQHDEPTSFLKEHIQAILNQEFPEER